MDAPDPIHLTEGSPTSIKPPAASSLLFGLVELPDYEILRELGRGGTGVVYLAQNKLRGRKEALKVVSHDLTDRRGVLDRFLREIRNAAQLHHPNIVTAYSAMRIGESIVFAMEYVEGYDVAHLVKANGPLAVAAACKFVVQAARGLEYAHQLGMVHRDVKPSHLVLARAGDRPVVKVLDFGLAKAPREWHPDTSLTQEVQMLGTPGYIAPEQSLDAQKADIRADIYSLGCTLYYLLTGAPPFQRTSVYEILEAHQSEEAEPVQLGPARCSARACEQGRQDDGEGARAPLPEYGRGGAGIEAVFPSRGAGAIGLSRKVLPPGQQALENGAHVPEWDRPTQAAGPKRAYRLGKRRPAGSDRCADRPPPERSRSQVDRRHAHIPPLHDGAEPHPSA